MRATDVGQIESVTIKNIVHCIGADPLDDIPPFYLAQDNRANWYLCSEEDYVGDDDAIQFDCIRFIGDVMSQAIGGSDHPLAFLQAVGINKSVYATRNSLNALRDELTRQGTVQYYKHKAGFTNADIGQCLIHVRA